MQMNEKKDKNNMDIEQIRNDIKDLSDKINDLNSTITNLQMGFSMLYATIYEKTFPRTSLGYCLQAINLGLENVEKYNLNQCIEYLCQYWNRDFDMDEDIEWNPIINAVDSIRKHENYDAIKDKFEEIINKIELSYKQ
jgi:hypothetical protein